MASLFAVGLTLVTLGQAYIAYLLCFEVTGLGGYLPFAIMTLPALAAAALVQIDITRRLA
jgi:hypothetical protein